MLSVIFLAAPMLAIQLSHGETEKYNAMDAYESPTGGAVDLVTEKTMPKVRPASQCVTSFGMQYFINYTVSAIVRTDNRFATFNPGTA